METEAAFNSSANSFILEKVLQEVKEVENRERVEAEKEAVDEDLKFRPGFVHILKDRFALLSIKSANINAADDDPNIKSSASVYDLSDSRNLGNSRHLSKSSEQLDGRNSNSRRRGSQQSNNSGSPSHRLNGSVAPNPTVSSRAYVNLHSDSPTDKSTRGRPSSIHVYSRSTDSRTLDRIRSAGNKVIIIESATKSPDSKKSQEIPPQTLQDNVDNTGSNENKPDEAWPVPNTVSNTRSFFEKNRVKKRAPPAPSSPSHQVSPDCKSPKSPSSPSRSNNDHQLPQTPPTQILVHGQPIKVHQTTLKSPTTEKSTKPPAPTLRRSSATSDGDSRLRKNSPGSSPKSVFLPASRVENQKSEERLNNIVDADSGKADTVVSVSEAKLMFDKRGSAPNDGSKMSPKKNRSLVFSASNSQQKPAPRKTAAPSPPVQTLQSNSAGPSSPKRTLYKATSLPSIVHKSASAPKPSAETSVRPTTPSSSGGRPIAVKSEPSQWQTWDDIPKPKRKSFVNEARRVDISKEDLSASRAKNKSFFFTVAEPAKKAQKVDDDIPNDKTVKISVPKSGISDQSSLTNTTKAPSESRLAQQTFWDSYRNEDVKNSSNVDSELFGDFLKLMESAKAASTDSASIERELDELPSTNIDDILNETYDDRFVSGASGDLNGVRGIRVINKSKKKAKPRLSFANDSCLTSTYEYPSERAMIEELGISPDFDLDGGGELSIDDPAALFGLDDLHETDDDASKTAKLLSGKPSVSSGSLASYKSKYGGNDYAWGQEEESAASQSVSRGDLLKNGDLEKVDSEPAEDESKIEEDMNWSSAATADLLF